MSPREFMHKEAKDMFNQLEPRDKINTSKARINKALRKAWRKSKNLTPEV